jgi:TPR repeat protein
VFKEALQAAEEEDPNACFMLGVCYGTGSGVERDMDQARSWCMKAADLGSLDAIRNLKFVLDSAGLDLGSLDRDKYIPLYMSLCEKRSGHAAAVLDKDFDVMHDPRWAKPISDLDIGDIMESGLTGDWRWCILKGVSGSDAWEVAE